ncbi:hypothetical protein PR048_020283 [Dryococelus australis]|uniref:Uncharacterized protein n=1 Tax=Dryococelus australis TaxID=614101 RepID=A0ABQ9H5V2_9NEOP|nr:hypothetical protein PR048_020283 [Dryococelus australis]
MEEANAIFVNPLKISEKKNVSCALKVDNQNIPSISRDCESSSEEKILLSGRRVVDIGHLLQSIQKISLHKPLECQFSDMEVMSERKYGVA